MTTNETLLQWMKDLRSDIKDLDAKLDKHMLDEEHLLEQQNADIVSLKTAFAEDDYVGHKLYHASIIERNRWIIQLLREVSKEIAKYGLIGAVLWTLYHAWIDFLAGPK